MPTVAKKILRILLISLVVMAALLLTAKHFIEPHIQPAAIKKRLLNQIHRKSTWQATLPDTLHIHWWPTPTLSTSNITLIDKHNPDQHYIKLPKITLSIAILPLLKGSVSISHISLTKPEIALDNSLLQNNSHPGTDAASPESHAAKPQQKHNTDLIIPDHISIANGTLTYHRRGKTHQLDLPYLDIITHGANDYRIKMKANYHQPQLTLKTINLDTNARWIIKHSQLILNHFNVSAKTTLSGITHDAPISLKAKYFEYHQAKQTWHIEGGKFSLLNLHGKADLKKNKPSVHSLDGTIALSVNNIKQLLSKLGQENNAIPTSKLTFDAAFNPSSTHTYAVALGNERIQIKNDTKASDTHQTSNNTIHANQFSPIPWLAINKAFTQFHGKLKRLNPLHKPTKATPTTHSKTVAHKHTVTTVINIDNLHQGTAKIKADWESNPSSHRITLSLNASQININHLVQSLKLKFGLTVESTASLSGNISTHGTTIEAMKHNTNGHLQVQLGRGRISSQRLQMMLSRFNTQGLHLDQSKTKAFKNKINKLIVFDSCIAHIDIKKGIANLDHIDIKAPRFKVFSEGHYHIPNNQFDAVLSVKVTKKFNMQLYTLQQELPGQHMTLSLTGPIGKPLIEPMYADMAAGVIKNTVVRNLGDIITSSIFGSP